VRRTVPFALLVLLSVFVVLSCTEDLSYELSVVNNSSRAIETVGITYTGIKAPLPDFGVDVVIPPGQTKTVELTLASSSNYYILSVWNDTDAKRIIWDGQAAGYEYVLLSKGGSSTCTVEDLELDTFAGENNVNPYSYDW
jgi:hypothetical protein